MCKAQLQWGHDKIVMEVWIRAIHGAASILLQWGHDKIVMEVCRKFCSIMLQRSSFNGAMTK